DTQKVEFPKKEMEVVRGQMVVLHAWYSPNSDISKNTVVWHFKGNESKQVINFSSGVVGHGQNEFTKRVGFSVAMPSANLSIYINNTQESDSGLYFCNVIIPGAPGLSGEMRLNVKPPSPPVCTMTGNPVVKGNVTLSCKSSHGKPVPQYKWTKAAPMSEVFFSPMQERHGTLRLSNLTKSMSGKYICRASNTAGSDSCSINLEVITSNAGMIAAATLGSVVGLVAMVLFLIFILRRRRDTEEEIANEIEDAQAPKRVSWAKSNTGSDIVSKNGTLSSIATSPRPRDPHQPNYHYPYSPISASDTGSVINAYQLRPGEANTLQGLPGYNMGGTPSRKHKRPPSTNGAPPQLLRSPAVANPKRTEGAQPQVPPPLTVSPQISSNTLTRMGAVAVMVPAQSQAGSLV
uniref:Endothelial cell-selective adhesion molecule-like n=1 Tax=Stegastes partitus TaxID=144197 RepID=A0A3B5B0N0_9TELE